MWNTVRALLVVAVIGLGIAHATDAPADVQAVFSRAAELVNGGHYTEALPLRCYDLTPRSFPVCDEKFEPVCAVKQARRASSPCVCAPPHFTLMTRLNLQCGQ